ncbi:hypothetical protein BD310DRAFT_1029167 [Dichomitus squalens]|uniref:Uncharacterized protein n=1 Tax=Dichomitus squalens TaxID=114155 RepID=A0A4Q9PMP2_9APHY|nr:hypothetical protein BD310DRAFT_1029167 [Dichomitus squalens]
MSLQHLPLNAALAAAGLHADVHTATSEYDTLKYLELRLEAETRHEVGEYLEAERISASMSTRRSIISSWSASSPWSGFGCPARGPILSRTASAILRLRLASMRQATVENFIMSEGGAADGRALKGAEEMHSPSPMGIFRASGDHQHAPTELDKDTRAAGVTPAPILNCVLGSVDCSRQATYGTGGSEGAKSKVPKLLANFGKSPGLAAKTRNGPKI